jgi:hypothetical protein
MVSRRNAEPERKRQNRCYLCTSSETASLCFPRPTPPLFCDGFLPAVRESLPRPHGAGYRRLDDRCRGQFAMYLAWSAETGATGDRATRDRALRRTNPNREEVTPLVYRDSERPGVHRLCGEHNVAVSILFRFGQHALRRAALTVTLLHSPAPRALSSAFRLLLRV